MTNGVGGILRKMVGIQRCLSGGARGSCGCPKMVVGVQRMGVSGGGYGFSREKQLQRPVKK